MPLVRVQVRNEYGLGLPELYKEVNKEDPKAVLDGVAVSGLVGILRQLGDLAEFAAEVFHGLQEQMMSTASRSHKLMVRVQHIEAALQPLERTILAQRSHLHFAYTSGSDWHACFPNEQNQFIYNDLPRFIMDSYEECRDPPRLHLLDKFDTGGPGSCLKRYSDPTFFKRVSGSLDEANAEKAPRNKKVHRSKKKRMRKRNGDISCGASISNDSGRMQFTSPNIDEQTSSQTISAFDVTLKSELGDQSNSFDSRTESGYIDCVFQPSYSMKPEEYEPKELSSFELKMHQNDTLDSAFVDGQSRNVDDDFPQSSSQEQTDPSSSCVTWDEKTEIVDPTSQQFDSDESPEGLPENFDLNIQQMEALNTVSVSQMDFEYDKESTPKSISGGDQLDDIESEPENYMDALNTIESECETDLDCQTKREVEQYSSYNDEGIKSGKARHGAHNSDGNSESNFESRTAADNEKNGDKLNSVSSESHTHEQSPEVAIRSSVPSDTSNIDYHGSAKILDGSNIESTVSSASSCAVFQETNSQAPTGDKILSSCEPRKPPTELSRVNSVTFWTNGGLLGLEPSKPPDFSTMNAVSQDSVARSKDEQTFPSSQTNILKDNGHAGNLYIAVKSSESFEQDTSSKYSKSCYNDQEGENSIEKTSCRFSSADLDVKLEKSVDSNCSNRFDHVNGHSLNETVVIAGTRQPATPDFKTLSTGTSQDDGENSSQMFGFSHGLLVNGFQRKVSLLHDEHSESAGSAKTGVFEQKSSNQSVACQISEAHFNKHFGSTVNSPSSSPTLEHMKISFQPLNCSEMSKLTLIFPDRNHCHENSRDLFTSFQLVPESAIPLHDGGSHSDDDTFCRSSLYASDDCLSHLSKSNSEQWESDETPQDPDPDLYDALCRISSTKSVSSSVELEATAQGSIGIRLGVQRLYSENDVEPSQSDYLLDLPIFDALNPLFKQEVRKDFDQENLQDSRFHNEPTPPPPPLPPLDWRVNKSYLDVAEDKQDAVSEALNYSLDMKPLESTISTQSKPSSVKQQQFEEVIAFSPNSKQPEQQKQNGLKENQPENSKGMEEKEDFLHQIRTKSLSLRRTVPAKQTFTHGPATNVKVSAILEKANAIRQAVGSDDGEDEDNWSDN